MTDPRVYRKFIVAVAFAALTALYAALTDDHIDSREWVGIGLAGVGALSVYAVPNRAPSVERDDLVVPGPHDTPEWS